MLYINEEAVVVLYWEINPIVKTKNIHGPRSLGFNPLPQQPV